MVPVFGAYLMHYMLIKIGWYNMNPINYQAQLQGQYARFHWHTLGSDHHITTFFGTILATLQTFLYADNMPQLKLFVTWTLYHELFNSYVVYVLALLMSHTKQKVAIYTLLIILGVWRNMYTAHFIIGLAIAEVSNSGYFNWKRRRILLSFLYVSCSIYMLAHWFGYDQMIKLDTWYFQNILNEYGGLGMTSGNFNS